MPLGMLQLLMAIVKPIAGRYLSCHCCCTVQIGLNLRKGPNATADFGDVELAEVWNVGAL